MTRWTRTIDRLRQTSFLLAERRLRFGLGSLVLLGLALSVIAVFYPDRFLTILLDSLITVLFALVTLFVSYDILLRYSRRSERDRIADDETIIDRYESRVPLMTRTAVAGWRERFGERQPSELPFVASYVPETPRSVDTYDMRFSDDAYSLPDRLSLVLDPVEEEQWDRFVSEGHYNGLKAGLTGIENGTFHFRPESYFQAFRTTHSPDYELYGGHSLRDLTDYLLFDDDGLAPLSESPFPNAFGGGGLLLTTDGRAVVPIRSAEVVYATGQAEVSFGGSFDLPLLERSARMSTQYHTELVQELSVPAKSVVDVYCLGVVRRLELLGSPDMLLFTLVDDDVVFENPSRENVRLIRMDLLPEHSDLSMDEILTPDVTATIAENLFERLDREGYLPGPALVATLVLLTRHSTGQ